MRWDDSFTPKMVDHTKQARSYKSSFPKLHLRWAMHLASLLPNAASVLLIFLFCWCPNISESYEVAANNSRNQKLLPDNNNLQNLHTLDSAVSNKSDSHHPSKLFKNIFSSSSRHKRSERSRAGKCKSKDYIEDPFETNLGDTKCWVNVECPRSIFNFSFRKVWSFPNQ